MKTKSLIRYALTCVTYSFVFIWAAFSANAQCPTINDPTPSICDASGYTFADLSNDYATDTGGGIVWYNSLTGGSAMSPSQLVYEGTFYADDNAGSCATRGSIVVDFQVNKSGQNLDAIYCSNENPTVQTYINDALFSSIPPGGSVEVYNDYNLTSLASNSDPLPSGANNYFIVFVDNLGCKSQIEIGTTAIFSSPADPTPTSPQLFCSDANATIGDLDTGTSSSVSWYQNVDGGGNPIPPALPLSTPLIDGNTYYVQIDDVFCDSHAIPVTVIIDDPNDPGTSASLDYCSDSVPTSAFDLFNELGGTPDITGTWSGPLATTNGYQGTVNISTLTTAGVYTFTYTVPSNGACPESSSNVSITIYQTFTSGTPSASNPATYCESTAPTSFDLFSLIDNEDANGQWTQGTLSTDPVVTSPIDVSALGIGTYNFTYTQNLSPNPCPEESTTVQVVVLPDPNAGNAVNQVFCENDLLDNSPFDLFNALDGSQDNNSGTWTDASNTTISNSLDISSFTVAGSPYSYNYTIDNGSCSDTETITITVEPSPESGTPVSTFPEFCEGSAPTSYDLFDLLTGADQTGTWYAGTDTSGSTVTNPIDLSGLIAGTYNFTYDVDAIGSCDDVLVTVSVTINPLPNTGIPSPATFCENDLAANSPLDLFAQLSGEDSGGTWTDDNTTGALTGSDVDLTALTIGTYNFTYSITDVNGCSNSSTVVVTVEDAPDSGNALAPFEVCEENVTANSPFDLFALLDGTQDMNGTWYAGPDTSGATVTNPIDISGLTSGTYNYTYSVPDIGSCSDVDVTVQIIVNPQPNTGTPTTAVFCENDLVANSPLDLFGQLSGEDSGGTWTDDDSTGALSGSDVDLSTLTIGSYHFTYSITDVNGCSNSSTVVVTVEDAPESGTANAPMEFCMASITTGQTVDLFDLLTGEDQTGTWSDDDSTGALNGNLVTIDGLTSGTYNFTYDVAAIGSCDDVLVTVSIVINDTPAPTASTPQEVCDSATISDLSATGTSIQWYDEASGGSPLAGTASLVDGETYYATQTDAISGCESSTRFEVIAIIHQTPNAGNPLPISVCSSDSAVDLNTGLDGTQDTGGVWQDTDATGALTGNIFDATAVTPGTYQFTYYVAASAPCSDDSTIITVIVEAPLNAGTDATLDVCSNNGTTDLFSLLGSADSGGTWSPAMASGTGVFDPLVDASGTYTYTLTNACGTFTSNVDVTVTQAPNAGSDNAVSICVIDGNVDLATFLSADAQSGGTWSPVLASGTSMFDPTVDTSGIYTYTVTAVSPCSPDSSAQITVTVNDSSAPTIVDASPEFCMVDNPTVADLDATITASGTVTWYTDSTLATALSSTDALTDGEDYFATQTNSSGCESSQSVQVDVTIHDTPTPTLSNSNLELCINDSPTIMDLTLNISEYDSNQNNVVWYDSATNGSTVSSGTALVNAATYYAALYDATTGCESSIRLAVTPDLTSCGKIALPDGFSPNGDGVNDTFDYNNLDILYPNFEIEIFNRYGTVVYKGTASSPRFDGTSNQSGSLGNGKLPVGVYFYIFNYNDGQNKPKQGRLYLSR
ncbi:hypothetical protein GCM10007962_03930 [Yeosuana aromativorans]|uniref:Ig-like domain-containing protein n=1 Tax=Yeosuana aromativorans TaxID=288019 RepID=A0A8J3FH52_9FLAO|nr:gliding motility-associated C-terminal domain-containing protein [Yeosuana aromativorans]GGK12791.1 hypothetical protein GCM10007962_03930 [Yeosuana aromativorans]